MTPPPSRRQFITSATTVLAAAQAGTSLLAAKPTPASGGDPRRIGAVAYAYQYSIGLFSYNQRPEKRMDALEFVEATHKAGGNVAQFFCTMITSLSDAELKRVRDRAAELDVTLEVHGDNALAPRFKAVLKPAVALGIKVVGCSFGMMMRPKKIATLDDPTEAADMLGPHIVATHFKDFAVVENATGFQVTMVPLGAGSLRLDEITARLLKHVSPDVNFSIEMMNGQQLQIDWLEDAF